MEEISCSVKPPVYLTVGSDSDGKCSSEGEAKHKSGCQVVEVQLREPSDVDMIRFRNNYTHSVSVLYQSSERESDSGTKKDLGSSLHGRGNEWKVGVANVVLMESCHCDSPGAQKWVELGGDVFKKKLEGVVKLRLILRQPSPCWKEFGVENVTCYRCHGDSSPEQQSTGSHDDQGEWSSWNKVERLLEVGQMAHSVLMSEKESTDFHQTISSSGHNSIPYAINLLSAS